MAECECSGSMSVLGSMTPLWAGIMYAWCSLWAYPDSRATIDATPPPGKQQRSFTLMCSWLRTRWKSFL